MLEAQPGPYLYSWEVDTVPAVPSSGFAAYDSYTLSGNNTDSYRVASSSM